MATSKRKNFFSLPPELRNVIYSLVAAESPSLVHGLKYNTIFQQVPSMLLTSRAVATEYKPVLLAVAQLRIEIQDANTLGCLARFIRGLPVAEFNALQLNPTGLTLGVPLELIGTFEAFQAVREAFQAVRDWLVERAPDDRLDGLRWMYEVQYPAFRPACYESGRDIFTWYTKHRERIVNGKARLGGLRYRLQGVRLDECLRIEAALHVAETGVQKDFEEGLLRCP